MNNARKGRKRLAVVAALLAGVGISTYANAQQDTPPPHEERVEYLLTEHKDTRFYLDYEPVFDEVEGWITHRDHVWSILYKGDSAQKQVLAIVDGAHRDDPADGTLDSYMTQLASDSRRPEFCIGKTESLPGDLHSLLDDQYEITTEAYYRHFEEGSQSFTGLISQEQFEELYAACKNSG